MNDLDVLRDTLLNHYQVDFGGKLPSGSEWNHSSFALCNVTCMEDQKEKSREKRDDVPPNLAEGPAVMYLPLGGGGGKGCPSLAETSVTGISQMVFLWTVMSVFNVVANIVANINNNQNNNNNNNNNLQINKISTQNTQISANTNNANTITIQLPPPIPIFAGGRKLDAQRRLKRFVERERKIEERKRGKGTDSFQKQRRQDSTEFLSVATNIMRVFLDEGSMEDNDCMGRQLCYISKDPTSMLNYQNSSAVKIITFALLWIKLEDQSQSFVEFLDNVVLGDLDQELDCDLIFYKC